LCSGDTRANTFTSPNGHVELVVGQVIELGTGHGRPTVADAEVAGDRLRRQRVVTGDHHRPDARRPARRHRIADLVAGRIDDADETDQHDVALDVVDVVDAASVEEAVPDAEDPHATRRHLVVRRQDPSPPLVGELDDTIAVQHCRRQAQHAVDGALHERDRHVLRERGQGRDRSVERAVDGAHPLALRIERLLVDPG
jgi:hypothetical protein